MVGGDGVGAGEGGVAVCQKYEASLTEVYKEFGVLRYVASVVVRDTSKAMMVYSRCRIPV